MHRIFNFILLVGLFLLCFVIHIDGQERRRTINDIYLPKDAPVQIVDRELGGRKFEDSKLNNRISGIANSDWVKHLTFVVKNISKKNISYVEISLLVPMQNQMPGPVMLYAIFGSQDGGDINGLIRPEETVKIKVHESEYLACEKTLKGWGVVDFDNVLLQLRAVYFDDGTGWSTGRDLVQNPLNPKKWDYVDKVKTNSHTLISFFGCSLQFTRLDAGFFVTSMSPEIVVCG
ncbi:MAG: hypothetical protein KA746_10935 [Pyrinomonadaceae bacterium]|nr:hypothetical protein [Pyrinomonadaceae bacterium]MBP6213084.1 hypothetical protein [Pyrinomonadaceae bacterium]